MIVFFWLSIEDSNSTTVAFFGVLLSLLLILHNIFRVSRQKNITVLPVNLGFLLTTVMGVLVGIGGILLAMLLMLIKTSLHGHLYPDYPFPMIAAMAARLPAWVIAGALIGAAVAVLHWSPPTSGNQSSSDSLSDDFGGLS